MKKKSICFTLTGCICLIVLSCRHEIPVVAIPPAGNTVCFENDVLPIFQSYCAKSGCHDETSRQNNYQLDTYANIVSRGIIAGDSSNSRIYQRITATDPALVMPQTPNIPLTPVQIHTIALWIKEGASNTTNCDPVCDSSQFTFSGTVQPILQTHCLGCHGGLAIDGGFIQLDNYDGVKEQVTSNILYPAITHTGANPMPKNGNKLSDCKIAVIRKWIEAGALNN